MAEAPLWKPTYRVMLDGKGAKVECWVAVENTSDEDWENVKLSLVSGRPVTYRMDLYEPLYVPRPQVEPERYASLRPPVYQGSRTSGRLTSSAGSAAQGNAGAGQLGQLGQIGNAGNLGAGGGPGGIGGGFGGGGKPGRPAG